jgi:ketosteroid isomerase-like protein
MPDYRNEMINNIATVNTIYEAFGRGDVQVILSCLAEDVEWDNRENYGIPLLVPRKGRAEVGRFFQEMANIELQSFSVKKLFDGGSSVVAWIGISWKWKASGRVFSDAVALHLWEFDSAGKVNRFFHVEDTHAMWLATRVDARP